MILLSEIQQQQKSFISWHTSESHSHKVICLIEVQISFIHDSAGQCFNDNHDQKKRRSKVLKSCRETCYISLETRNKTMPTPPKKAIRKYNFDNPVTGGMLGIQAFFLLISSDLHFPPRFYTYSTWNHFHSVHMQVLCATDQTAVLEKPWWLDVELAVFVSCWQPPTLVEIVVAS